MKRTVLRTFFIAGITAGFSIAVQAQTTLLHYWHFNSLSQAYNNPGIPAFKADYSVIDTNLTQFAYQLKPGTSSSYSGYIDNVSGSDSNARMSTPAGRAYRFRNPSDSAQLLMFIPTTGYEQINIKYALQSSSINSGMLAHLFDYSVDSGSSWRTAGLNITIDSASRFTDPNWGVFTINLTNEPAANNNPRLVFRIKFDGNTSGTSGNNRFDNVTVEGHVLQPSSIGSNTALASAARIYPNPATDQVIIYTGLQETHSVGVYATEGRRVLTSVHNGPEFQLSTGDLPSGLYYVHIMAGTKIRVLNFTKN